MLKAALFTSKRRSVFSLIGISKAFLTIGVFQLTSPTPFTGASLTGSIWNLELAFAIATAWRAVLAIESGVTSDVEAKPQVPLAITLMPIPADSVLTMLLTTFSRVVTN